MDREDYDEAKRLKGAVDALRAAGGAIAELEAQKRAAVEVGAALLCAAVVCAGCVAMILQNKSLPQLWRIVCVLPSSKAPILCDTLPHRWRITTWPSR